MHKTLLATIIVGLLWPVSGAATAQPRGKVTVAMTSDIPSLDPQASTGQIASTSALQIFDPLVERDVKTMRLVPYLAESWRHRDDRTWELKLRRGIRFHNGESFTAHSVAFTVQRASDPKSAARPFVKTIDRVQVVDDETVLLVTKVHDPLLLDRLARLSLLPPAYLKQVGDAKFAVSPVGTGPYRVVEWKKGSHLLLEANDGYWRGAPAVRTVIIRPVPEPAARIAELLTQGVDLIEKVSPDELPQLKASTVARAVVTSTLRVAFLQIDTYGRAAPSPVTDLRVRQAINHAVDVEALRKHILAGSALAAPTAVSPISFGYDPSIKPYSFSGERARQLLKDAGYPNGFDTTLTSYGVTIPGTRQLVEAISGYLQKVGIRVKHQHIEDMGTYNRFWRGGKLQGLTLASWGSWSIPDADAAYYDILQSASPYSYVSDKQIDAWLEEGRTTLDPARRRQIYAKLQQYLVEKAYLVPLFTLPAIWGVNNKLNFDAPADEFLRLAALSWRE